MAKKLITPPTTEPVTLAEAKGHIRVEVTFTDDDASVTRLIKAARVHCEKIQNRALITQDWRLSFDSFPTMPIKVPNPPFQSLVSVTYKDQDGNVTTMSITDFAIDTDSEPGRIGFVTGKTWPSVSLYPLNPVNFVFRAGYGNDASAVPENVRQAMLLLIGYWYENREAAISGAISREIEFSVNALLDLDRVVPV